MGSSTVDQQPLSTSRSSRGSKRVHMAQITLSISAGWSGVPSATTKRQGGGAARPPFGAPPALHFGDTGGFELVPHRARAIGAAIERVVVRRHAGDRAHQDRVVAIHEGFDPDRGLFLQTARVVAGPFAERAFLDQVVRMDEAFEGDLGMRWDGKAG